MPHDPATLLHDIRTAAEFIPEQTRGCILSEYEHDRLLSAAVERQLITIGEALNRLARVNSTTAAALGNYPQLVAFRNVIVHGYDIVEHAIVWGIVQNELPRLLAAVGEKLHGAEGGR